MSTGVIDGALAYLGTTSSNSTYTVASGVSVRTFGNYKFGRICMLYISFDITSAKSNGDTIISGIPSGYRPLLYTVTSAMNTSGGYGINFNSSGVLFSGNRGLPVATWYSVTLTYIADK